MRQQQTRHVASVVSYCGERKSLTVLLERCDYEAIEKIAKEHGLPTGSTARALLRAELLRIKHGEEPQLGKIELEG